MANTYSQIYIQIVFAVRGRQNLIHPAFREEVQKYITGIVENRGTKLLAIYCMPDHTHILIGMKPSVSLSSLVADIKKFSTNYINENGWIRGRFAWQNGFGAFSYSQSHLDNVIRYIRNQETHHGKTKFREEYFNLLNKYKVDHDPKYLFDWQE